MMNTEDFVTYEQALALKKLGFKEKCLYYYNQFHDLVSEYLIPEKDSVTTDELYYSNNENTIIDDVCDAPTLAQVQKWLYKPKDLKLFIIPSDSRRVPYSYVIFNTAKTIYKNPPRYYSSYVEAFSAGITECIKILNEQK